MRNDNHNETTEGDSRRSFMKKGALATGALALGAGATMSSTSAQDVEGEPGLVYSYQFYPTTDFTVVEQLRQETTSQLLTGSEEEAPIEIGDLADWRGHIIRYEIGDGSGITAFLFLREQRLSAGDSSTTGSNAQMYSTQLNLLETTLGGGEQAEEEPADNQTEAPDNETEVVDNETVDNETAGNETVDNETEVVDNETVDNETAGNETESSANETADNETALTNSEGEDDAGNESGLQIDVWLSDSGVNLSGDM